MPDVAPRPRREPIPRVVPSWTEPLARSACGVVGGPLGRHAVLGRSAFWTPLRVVLLAAVAVLALGWLVKAPCLQQEPGYDGAPVLDWDNGRQYLALCYTDLVTLPNEDRLLGDDPPYQATWNDPSAPVRDQVRYLDEPVVSGYLLWLVARGTLHYQDHAPGLLPTGLTEVVFFDLIALVLAALWLVVVCAVCRLRPGRPWDAMLVALSPLALLHVFTGTEVVGLAGAAAGLWIFSRGRPVPAGILLGVAAAANLLAASLLVPLLLVGRRRGTSGPALRTAISAFATWFVLNAPVAVFLTPGWLEQFRGAAREAAGPDSVWFALSYFSRWPGLDGELPDGVAPARLNLLCLGLLVAALVGVAVLAHRAPVPPRVASLAFLVLAAALLLGKDWNPQTSLWLVPAAVLALPRWRLLTAWMTLDALVWVPRLFYYRGADNRGLPADPFLVTVLLRDAMVLLLAGMVIRTVLRPETDPLRPHPRLAPPGGAPDQVAPSWSDPDWPFPPAHALAAGAAGAAGAADPVAPGGSAGSPVH